MPLSMPVIVPQRRPEKKARGWAICYAPALENSGIDEKTFIDFILDFNKACQASPALDVVNLAAIGVGFVPGIAPMIIGLVVPIAIDVAKRHQTNYQASKYLAKANNELFEPRGLYAMLTTWDSKQKSQAVSIDLNSSAADSSTGERFELPPSAPLIFYDERELLSDKPQNRFQRSSRFVSDYVDRRKQAKYAMEHPEMQNLRPEPKFYSRWSDPHHPANSGGLVALVSGGLIQKDNKTDRSEQDERRSRRTSPDSDRGSQRRSRRRGSGGLIGTAIGAIGGEKAQHFQEHGLIGGLKSMALGPENADKGLITGIKGMAGQENLLYLMIVNKPSAEAQPTPEAGYPNRIPNGEPANFDPLYANRIPTSEPPTSGPFYSNEMALREPARDSYYHSGEHSKSDKEANEFEAQEKDIVRYYEEEEEDDDEICRMRRY